MSERPGSPWVASRLSEPRMRIVCGAPPSTVSSCWRAAEQLRVVEALGDVGEEEQERDGCRGGHRGHDHERGRHEAPADAALRRLADSVVVRRPSRRPRATGGSARGGWTLCEPVVTSWENVDFFARFARPACAASRCASTSESVSVSASTVPPLICGGWNDDRCRRRGFGLLRRVGSASGSSPVSRRLLSSAPRRRRDSSRAALPRVVGCPRGSCDLVAPRRSRSLVAPPPRPCAPCPAKVEGGGEVRGVVVLRRVLVLGQLFVGHPGGPPFMRVGSEATKSEIVRR